MNPLGYKLGILLFVLDRWNTFINLEQLIELVKNVYISLIEENLFNLRIYDKNIKYNIFKRMALV